MEDGNPQGLPEAQRLPRAILFLAGFGAIVYGQVHWGAHLFSQGLPWMFAGILLTAAARPRLIRERRPEPGGTSRLSGSEIAFVGALLLVGGAIRFAGLDRLPPGGFFDEVEYHRIAEGILAGDRPIFIRAIQLPALFVYLLAAGIGLFGKGLATVRGVSALLGTLTLPVFYLLARRAFSRPVAAAAAILLAGSRWHITFSRVVFSAAIAAPLLEVAAVLFFWRAAESRKALDYVLLGAALGIGLQTYYAFNLFPAVLAVVVVSFAARLGRGRFWSELGRVAKGLLWSALVAILLLLPLARFAIRNWSLFSQRTSTVAIWNPAHHLSWPGALWQNTVSHLLMFNFRGDYNPRHNIPDEPLLNPAEAILLVVGLGATLARAVKWPQAVWIAWFAVMLLPAILTIESPQAHRAVGAIPAVYLLIAEGLQGLFSLATVGARRARVTIAATLLLVASAAAASQDVWRYFRVQVVHPLAWPAFEADEHAIAKFIQPFANRDKIEVSGVYYQYPVLRFHLGDNFPYVPFRLADELTGKPSADSKTEGTLYVLEPFQKDLFPLYQELYPHARLEEHHDPFGRLMFVSIFVPRRDRDHPSDPQARQRGFLGAYYDNEEWRGNPSILRRDPTILFHFHLAQEGLPGDFTTDWAAYLTVAESGPYTFQLVTSGPTLLIVDGEKVIETREIDKTSPLQGTVTLSAGSHPIVVRYLKKGFHSTIQLLWQPPSGERGVIPLRLLRQFSEQEYARLRDRLPLPLTQ